MSKRKIIGVTPLFCDEKQDIWMLPAYMDMLQEAGLLPVILPSHADGGGLEKINSICDGYLFTGGHDVDPKVYGCERTIYCGIANEDRDTLEKQLFQLALLLSDKPVLGICRGIQLINAVMGGTLYQDLPAEYQSDIEHHMSPPYNRYAHMVTIQPGGILSKIIPDEIIGVNSYHHQAIKTLADGLFVEAVSEDGLVDGISCPKQRFMLAVQWHPEYIYRDDENCVRIVKAFADAVYFC